MLRCDEMSEPYAIIREGLTHGPEVQLGAVVEAVHRLELDVALVWLVYHLCA